MEARNLKKSAKQIRKDSIKNPTKVKKTKNDMVTHCHMIGEEDGKQSSLKEGDGYATNKPPAGYNTWSNRVRYYSK